MTFNRGEIEIILIALRRCCSEGTGQIEGSGTHTRIGATAWYCTQHCVKKFDALIARIEAEGSNEA